MKLVWKENMMTFIQNKVFSDMRKQPILIKMSDSDKEYLYEIADSFDIITREDVDKFVPTFTKCDKTIIDSKKNRCAWWTLKKDGAGGERYVALIEKYEKQICERIKKRISK